MIPIQRFQSKANVGYFGFLDIMQRLWKAAGYPGEIIRSKPKNDVKYPIITFSCQGRRINPHFKDLKPRYRDFMKHPDIPDEFVEVYGQIFDVLMGFTISAEDGDEADEIMFLFEDFVKNYVGYFKAAGLQEMLFQEQLPDRIVDDKGFTVHERTLIYKTRFERHTYKVLGEIEEMAIKAGIKQDI